MFFKASGLSIRVRSAKDRDSTPMSANIFSLFNNYNGKFVTTDINVCVDSRFDKGVKRE
ncbi:MAG: YoaP domain-containing protein [Tannerella sp.]|nr:YoaP domain-containing protein [Tannerella sp.]